MIASRKAFEALAQSGAGDARALGAALKAKPSAEGLQALAALWIHAAVCAPERIAPIFDAAADGWSGRAVGAPPVGVPSGPAEPISQAFWDALWALLDMPQGSMDAGQTTQRTADLAAHLSAGYAARSAAAALAFPGCAEAVAQGYPERFTLEALARCPADSLGGDFHRLIVDNGFDLEVLDREALGLADLPPPLDYLNARILQCHDLWHLAAGYRTTGLHEVAISGFQLGQFGHHYSAMFLAMALTRAAFQRPEATPLLLDTILSAWVHGRQSPPLLGVDWEAVWDRPVAAVRAELGLSAYASPWPADLFEQLAAAA